MIDELGSRLNLSSGVKGVGLEVLFGILIRIVLCKRTLQRGTTTVFLLWCQGLYRTPLCFVNIVLGGDSGSMGPRLTGVLTVITHISDTDYISTKRTS